MSKLLMNLRNVPDDELADVRAMLDEHRIAYYETKPSRWGISFGGVWVAEASDFAEAKRLMAVYRPGDSSAPATSTTPPGALARPRRSGRCCDRTPHGWR